MDIYEYGNPDSSTVLLQMVDDHDLAVIENEVAAVRTGCCARFMLGRQQTVLCGRLFSGWSVCFVGGVSDGRVRRGGGGVAFGVVSRFCGLHGRACDKMQAGLSESGGQGREGAESGDGCCGREYSQGV